MLIYSKIKIHLIKVFAKIKHTCISLAQHADEIILSVFSFNYTILFLILLFTYCKKEISNQNESYESYVRNSTHKMCEKLIICYTSITRTFPSELQTEVNIENCENTALVDLDEKLSLHTETMKALSKGCYEKLLESECKDFLTFAYADTSCYMLKKESDSVYAKANQGSKIKRDD